MCSSYYPLYILLRRNLRDDHIDEVVDGGGDGEIPIRVAVLVTTLNPARLTFAVVQEPLRMMIDRIMQLGELAPRSVLPTSTAGEAFKLTRDVVGVEYR